MRVSRWRLMRPRHWPGILSVWLKELPPWVIFVIAGLMVLLGFLSSML